MPALFCVFWGVCLAAQGSLPSPRGIEEERPPEIVVTGERVDRSLLETPSSVVVVDQGGADGLPGSGGGLEDLLATIPNVAMGSGGEGPTVRGQDTTGVLRDLSAFLGGTRPRLTIQTDGRASGYNEFVFGAVPLWDVERVEIFRSPQTTTQGRNSIAGAIFVHTRDPTYHWEGGGRLVADDSGTRRISGMVSGPLLREQAAFRLAGELRTGRSSSRLAEFVPSVEANDDKHSLLRAKLLAEPSFLPGLRVETSFGHLETQAPQIEGLRPPFERREDPRPAYGVFATNVETLSLIFDYPLSASLRTTVTVAAGESSIQRFARPGLGQNQIESQDRSIETLLRWEPLPSLEVVGGVYVAGTALNQFTDLSALIGIGRFEDEQGSLGIFGEATMRMPSRFTITGGLRYQRDSQDREGSVGRIGRTATLNFRETFEAWLPKVSIAYRFSDVINAGLLVQRAYNPGGTTLDLRTGGGDRFAAESLWNYELFARGVLAGGRLTISSNLFINDITNAQRPQVQAIADPDGSTELALEIGNAPRARSSGLELGVSWRPRPGLAITAGLGLLDTKILETMEGADPILGKEFQRAPAFTGSLGVEWQASGRLGASAQLRHHGGYFSDDINSASRRIVAATMADARLSYRLDSVTLFGFARNIFDEFNLTYLFSRDLATAAEPREIGVGLEARF